MTCSRLLSLPTKSLLHHLPVTSCCACLSQAGNLYAHLTNSPGLIPILSGVFLIVPGSMGGTTHNLMHNYLII